MRKIDDINWHYKPAAKTNVLETLKREGWIPPSEDLVSQEKFKRYRNALSINEGNQNEKNGI